MPFTAEEAAEASSTLLDLASMVAGRLDPGGLVAAEAMAQLKVISQTRKVLAGVEMALSARVSESEQWKDRGDRTAAERIAKVTGKSKRQAEDDLRTAKAAEDNPQLADAIREGRVSPEQAKEIGAAGQADPDATGDLLELVEKGASLGDVRDEAEKRRREAEGEDHKRRNRARAKARRFTKHWNKDEMFFFMLGVPLEHGARILANLEIELDHVIRAGRNDPGRGTWENCRADAATNLLTNTTAAPQPQDDDADADAEDHRDPWDEADSTGQGERPDAPHPSECDQGDLFASPTPNDSPPFASSGGDPPGTGPPDAAPPPTRARPRPRPRSQSRSGPPLKSTPSGRLVARLDLAHLWGQPGDATCEIAGIGTVSLDALAAALPEPWIQLVLTRGKDVLNVTNIGRSTDLWQQAALDWTIGPRCTDIGCNRSIHIQNDHRVPWTVEQITQLQNMDPLCPWSHYLKTHHGYALEPGTGRRRLLPPHHPDHPNNTNTKSADA